MEKYVEFYFPGRVFVGSNEIKVSSFDVETAKIKAPTYAIAFDFFEKDSCGKKKTFQNVTGLVLSSQLKT